MSNKGAIKPGEVRNPYGRKGKPKANAASPLVSRRNLSSMAGQHFGGDRDLYQTMGYPRSLMAEDYSAAYLRQDIAARIIDAYPDATWREPPELKASDAFLATWRGIDKRYQLWRTLHRLDRLAQVGHYGVLFMGLDGGERPDQPATGRDYSLIYLQPHSERTAQIIRWDNNPQSPRFGMPQLYRLTTGVNWTGAGAGQRDITVHHSRVIHIAERPMEDASIGSPRIERVWNRLMDLDKLAGGSAEMYWQNVAMLMAFLADKDAEFEPEEREQMQQQLEEMQHGVRRMLRLRGMTAENLAPGMQGSDPTGVYEMLITLIAGSSGIPKRILLGNEAGELASSQDETAWAARIAERREQFASPSIIEPVISAGQRLGWLPDGFGEVEWPEADTLGEVARADIALKKAQTAAAYSNAMGVEQFVTRDEFREWIGEDPMVEGPPEPDMDESDDQVIEQFKRAPSANGLALLDRRRGIEEQTLKILERVANGE